MRSPVFNKEACKGWAESFERMFNELNGEQFATESRRDPVDDYEDSSQGN